jgi:3-hydroxybutyrate dehydrogenase
MKLKDKAAVITGAGSGIGRASALEFAREGARVGVAAHAGDGRLWNGPCRHRSDCGV